MSADLPPCTRGLDVLSNLDSRGLSAYALSYYSMQRRDLNGLVLGFGGTHENRIPAAVEELCACLSAPA